MPITLSNHPQLFLDDYLISRLRNLRRDMKQPVKHPANPLLVQQHPWEKRLLGYVSVLYDDDWGKFRLWYLCNEKRPADPKYAVSYAESSDGVRWTKPMVGHFPFREHKKHNIVITEGHGVCVLKTPWDPDPNLRYKAAGGDLFAVSPDGIHWTCHDWTPAVGKNDTGQSVVWWKGQYLAYVRYQCPAPGLRQIIRGIGLSTSKDFKRWTKKRLIWKADEKDGHPWGQPHALAVTAYGDVLIGLLPMMDIIPEVGDNIMGEMPVELMVSRDGRKWHRVADRAQFMPQDKPQRMSKRAWDLRFHPGGNMFVKDDKVYIYYAASKVRWGEGKTRENHPQSRPCGMGLATVAADRFVSLRPVNFEAEGTLWTKPLLLAGKDLLVNADIQKDELQVELLDASKKVIAGFGRDQSRLVRHDKLRYRAMWCGRRGGLKALHRAPLDKPVMLRFTLRNGDLYSFAIK